jgi:vacuolar protein sorting-associated protein 1
MDQLANGLVERVFFRFPTVSGEIADLTSRVLQQQRDKAKQVLENQLDSELDYIFTNDQDYLTSRTVLSFEQNKKVDPKQVVVKELR